jgi:pyruvate/2-oxoglutarate/acetoin dehydrogenase E1 component
MKRYLLLLLLVGCGAQEPEFRDVRSKKPAVAEVTIKHRIGEAAQVAAECAMRNRAEGKGQVHEVIVIDGRILTFKNGPAQDAETPACSWTEPDGTKVVYCTNPKSFNNNRALLACGHEAFHFHEEVDHE